jgi:hypothetical protein
MYGRVDVLIHVFLTSALVVGEWSASRSGCFQPEKKPPGTLWKGRWMGSRAGLNDAERTRIVPLPGLELRPLGSLAYSQSLCRLSYHASLWRKNKSWSNLSFFLPAYSSKTGKLMFNSFFAVALSKKEGGADKACLCVRFVRRRHKSNIRAPPHPHPQHFTRST